MIFMTFPPLLQGKKARRPFERVNSTTGFSGLWRRAETALESALRPGLARMASFRLERAQESGESVPRAFLRTMVKLG